MSLVLITPGTGSFHCGSCLRDDTLAHALRKAGRAVEVVPLYLPMVTDRASAAGDAPIFFGGVNVYLQQHSSLFRHAPAWIDRLFDAPAVLRAAGRRAGMTDAADLGALTLSMLRGAAGHQHKEVERLVAHLAERRPDPSAVCLSNALLLGMARPLRERLGVPVVVSLQGEDAFLDALPEPHRSRSWDELREQARFADAFVAVSSSFGRTMGERMEIPADRLHVIPNGIDVAGYGRDEVDPTAAPGSSPDPPVVGFLARMCADKGLGALVEAFIELVRRPGLAHTRLHIAGAMTAGDAGYVAGIRERLGAVGLGAQVQWSPNLDLAHKQDFLRSLSVLSVPAMYGEAFGLYLLEAWASAVPVVQPRVASFPELIADTGAGVQTEGDGATELADGLAELLRDAPRRHRLGQLGRAAVLDRYTDARMARDLLALLDGLEAPRP